MLDPNTPTIRTDLAVEARQLSRERAGELTELPGIRASDTTAEGFPVSVVEVLDGRGEKAIGKPVGRYVTLELDALMRREDSAFSRGVRALAALIRDFLPEGFSGDCLVVGLGNREITPDAVGPLTAEHDLATRHLKVQLPRDFAAFRSVSAVCTGVLGTTGIESGDFVRALAQELEPGLVFAVDALASRSMDRLCRTVQLSDTGIVPGSGVGNARLALNRESLGVPVIAIGVPTVVDAATLTLDLAGRAGISLKPESFGPLGGMIVTPRDIDRSVRDVGKLIGYGLNMAFHDGLTVEEMDMLLS